MAEQWKDYERGSYTPEGQRVVLSGSGAPGADGYIKVSQATSTAVVTSVADTATSTTLKAANAAAKERIIQNDSTSILYIKHGTTASATDYTIKLGADDVWATEYNGRIDGIWSADASGAAKITEHS
jgi:hypothetical protein